MEHAHEKWHASGLLAHAHCARCATCVSANAEQGFHNKCSFSLPRIRYKAYSLMVIKMRKN